MVVGAQESCANNRRQHWQYCSHAWSSLIHGVLPLLMSYLPDNFFYSACCRVAAHLCVPGLTVSACAVHVLSFVVGGLSSFTYCGKHLTTVVPWSQGYLRPFSSCHASG